MPSISIIIPIFNEIEKLPLLIKQLEPYKYKNQIIIVNDGSQDGSKEFLNSQNNLTILHHNDNLGKGAAVQTALKKVKKDFVMIIDGDLEISFENLNSIIQLINKHKIIVGYRYSINKNYFSLNEIGSSILNFIFNIIFSSNFKDVLCCLKIIPTETLRSFKLTSNGFDLETEIMANICLNNLNVIEKAVIYKRRTTEEGKKLRISDSILILKKMFSFSYEQLKTNK